MMHGNTKLKYVTLVVLRKKITLELGAGVPGALNIITFYV